RLSTADSRVSAVFRRLDRRGLGAGGAIPERATEAEVRRFQDARVRLNELVRGSDITAKRAAQIHDNLKAKYRGIERETANALLRIQQRHRDLGKTADKEAERQARAAERVAKANAKVAAANFQASRELAGQRTGSAVTADLLSRVEGPVSARGLNQATAGL